MVNLNPTRGHEQAGTRPALVLSIDPFNHGPAGLVIVLPITSTDRRIPAHIPVDPPEGGLGRRSFILTDAIRSISQDRLVKRRGVVGAGTLGAVERGVAILLGL